MFYKYSRFVLTSAFICATLLFIPSLAFAGELVVACSIQTTPDDYDLSGDDRFDISDVSIGGQWYEKGTLDLNDDGETTIADLIYLVHAYHGQYHSYSVECPPLTLAENCSDAPVVNTSRP